jgi:hypothetical protein
LERIPEGLYVYLCDDKTGVRQNMAIHKEYRIYLSEGKHHGRFSVMFSDHDLRVQPTGSRLHVYSYRNRLYVYQDLLPGESGSMEVFNLQGQKMMATRLQGQGYQEIDVNFPTGIYIVGLKSESEQLIRKVFINSQWE